MGVFFNGRFLISPTTASAINDDAMRNQNVSVGNTAVMVGRSIGGKPGVALRFGSPQEAEEVLGAGELLDAVRVAFDPSNQTGGPLTVVAVRVNPAVQATAVVKGAGNADVINLTSIGYGLRENQVRVKFEAGSLSGRRVTTQRGTSYYTQDNVGRQACTIRYTGSEATGTLSVTGTSVVLSAPATTAVATLSLEEFPTVNDLVDRINLVPGFAASVSDRSGNTATLNGLDFVTGQDVKTATYGVRADLQAVIDWLNSAQQRFVRATRAANAATPPVVAPFKFLAGGSDGVTTFDTWASAFEALQGIDVQWVTPVSGDEAIHALADSHAQFMAIRNRERRVVVGTDVDTSDEAAIAAAKALNSDRTSLVHLGHYNYDDKGKLVLFPPYISAALISGAFAGVSPGTPLTNKTIKVRGLERDLRNPTDTDVLIQAGVLCLENTEQGYKVVQSISTWLVNDNYNRREQSTGVALDYTARNVRDALDVLRGQKNSPLLLSRAISITQSVLKELAREEPQGPGVLAGDAENPAFRNITASIEGDVIRVNFECSPVIPANYVLATIYAVPFSGVAIAA